MLSKNCLCIEHFENQSSYECFGMYRYLVTINYFPVYDTVSMS